MRTGTTLNNPWKVFCQCNAIIGFSEVIASGLMGPVAPPVYGEYAANIMESGRHLLDVINDILDVSRVEAGKMTLHAEAVDFPEVTEAAVRLLSVRAEHAKVDLAVDLAPDLPRIWGRRGA